MDINGKPMLLRVIERIKHSKLNQKIIIATSINKEDDEIYDFARSEHIDVFRGSQSDVLHRYYKAAENFNVDVIVRVTADCPLIDPYVMDLVIQGFLDNNKTIVTNAGIDLDKRTYPRGLDVEVFSFDALLLANKKADQKYQREHVTPYLYQDINGVSIIMNNVNLSNHRWTVDTPEDMEFIRKVYSGFDSKLDNLDYKNIILYLENNPNLLKINDFVVQKKHLESQ
jgi:spore coat polysaccharide biosynthesis protein SpsF